MLKKYILFLFVCCGLCHNSFQLIHNFLGEFGCTVEIINTVLFLFHVVKLRIAKTANLFRVHKHIGESDKTFHTRMSAKVCLKSNRNLLKMKDKHPVIQACFLIPRDEYFWKFIT